MLWGAIVLNFDRWIVSSIDYGPLTAEDAAQARPRRTSSKVVHFAVRFTMSALVGLVISEPIVLAIFGPEISQQLAAQHVTDIRPADRADQRRRRETTRHQSTSRYGGAAALRAATRKAGRRTRSTCAN